MAWHSGKPADNDFLSASVRHIRENFAELEPLHPHVAELVDLTTLHPHVAAILDSRIVEMGSNANGEYVRWENGLQVCFRSVVLNVVSGGFLTSGSQQWPAEFSARPFVTAPTYQTLLQFPFENVSRTDIKNVYYHNLTSADFHIRMYQDGSGSFQDGDSIDVFVIAIGRWK